MLRNWKTPHGRTAPLVLLFVFVGISLVLTKREVPGLQWSDEAVYFTVARNIKENLDFDSHHYLASSILKKGYPTKDVHLPGYPLLISIGFLIEGVDESVPFHVNYFLLGLSVMLMFLIGTRIANAWVGLLAALIYLAAPTTLSLAHSGMSEPSAAAAVLAIVATLILLDDGVAKGCLLAVTVTVATLIKPYLVAFMPAIGIYLLLANKFRKPSTIVALLATFFILAIFVIVPLSSNREIYPYIATRILAAPSLGLKLKLISGNLEYNLTYLANASWLSRDGLAFGGLALLLISAVFFLIRLRPQRTPAPISIDYRAMFFVTVIALAQVMFAVCAFYEVPYFKGLRALASFFPPLIVLAVVGAWHWTRAGGSERLHRRAALSLSLGTMLLLVLLLGSVETSLESNRTRSMSHQRLVDYYDRLDRIIHAYGLDPRMVMSYYNFLLPVRNFPVKVVWEGPQDMHELLLVTQIAPVDLIELPGDSELVRENAIKYRSDALFDSFPLFHQEDGRNYYRRMP